MSQTYGSNHIRFMRVVLGGSIPSSIHPSILPSYCSAHSPYYCQVLFSCTRLMRMFISGSQGVVFGGSIPPSIHPSVLPSYSPAPFPSIVMCWFHGPDLWECSYQVHGGSVGGFYPSTHPSLRPSLLLSYSPAPPPSIVMCCFHGSDLWECSYQVHRASVGVPSLPPSIPTPPPFYCHVLFSCTRLMGMFISGLQG